MIPRSDVSRWAAHGKEDLIVYSSPPLQQLPVKRPCGQVEGAWIY